ncbi:MAG: outer membrane porin, OprD family [Magnetococcales bacterium]|nr:outer membrane porin, OprD family [Magnetococcales bacterium]
MRQQPDKRYGCVALSMLMSLITINAPPDALATDTATHPFIEQSKAGIVTRLATFHRFSPNFNQDGAGLGGWLYGTTGELADTLSFGGAYYFVEPIHDPENRRFNYVLKDPGQDGFGVLGEAYAKLRHGSHSATIGRQVLNFSWYMDDVHRVANKLDQSMVGRRDVRGMHPITYEALTIQGRLANETLRYYVGYATSMKQINDDRFRNFYQGAFQTTVFPDEAKQGDADGMLFAGAIWKPEKNLMLTGSHHIVENLLNMSYADIDYVHRLSEKRYLRLGTQYMRQSSQGNALITNGREFNTQYAGVYGETRLTPWLIPYGMAGLTSDAEEIRAPYSIGPSYLVQRVGENSKAGERTWIMGSVVDFGTWGAQGLSFDLNYGQRSQRHLAGSPEHGLPDWHELAADLVYTLPQEAKFFKNLRLRLRPAKVWEQGEDWSRGSPVEVNRITNDVRIDATLNFPFR